MDRQGPRYAHDRAYGRHDEDHWDDREADHHEGRKGGGVKTIIIAVAALVALAALGMFGFVAESSRAGPNETEGAVVVVPRGAGVTSIAASLEQEGHIRNALVFRLAYMVYGNDRPMQAGEYEIPVGASPRAIIELMTGGGALQHAVTIPEGLTSEAIVAILARSDVLTGDVPPAPPEGAILPETYSVERGTDRTLLLRRMMNAHDEAVREIWAARAPDLPIDTIEEFVTLASIVERETGVSDERPRVAAVFINRLRRGMPLQSDPTIIYGVCRAYPQRCREGRLINERTGQIRTIRQSEIQLDTGYNTYRIPALPPGPIANPGRASLEAVANPARTNDLFFVADGTGGHAFAATLAEHERNVRRWREIERLRLQAEGQ